MNEQETKPKTEQKTNEQKTEKKTYTKKPKPVIVGHLWEPINPKGSSTEDTTEPATDPKVEAIQAEIKALRAQLVAVTTGPGGWGANDRIAKLEAQIAKLEAQQAKPKHVSVWDNPTASTMGIASRRGRR